MSHLLERTAIAVASPDDAAATARAVRSHFEAFGDVTLLHVVEKAGGAPDKASVEQREERAQEAFEEFGDILGTCDFETEIVYATDIVDGIVDASRALDATAVAFTPRDGGTLARLLSGDVSDRLIRASHVPVLAFPAPEGENA